jgi:integrase
LKVAPQLSDFTPYTIAWILQRYVEEMPLINADKPIRGSHLYAITRLQKWPIGQVAAKDLKKGHIIEHCKMRRSQGVKPQTINQDVTFLRGPLKFAGSAWDDCEDLSDAAITAAMPFLKRYNLIGKSKPRERRPAKEELDALLALFAAREAKNTKRFVLPMTKIVEFSLWSARRISETCRITFGDVNGADMTCILRDMKDPKNKKGNDHEFPLLGRAWDLVQERALVRKNPNDPNERIFPYRSQSASQSYTLAKKKLGIPDLHLHDNRAECASRLLEGYHGIEFSIPQTMVVTGHKNAQTLMRVYARLKAKNVPKLPTLTPAIPAVPAPAAEEKAAT